MPYDSGCLIFFSNSYATLNFLVGREVEMLGLSSVSKVRDADLRDFIYWKNIIMILLIH